MAQCAYGCFQTLGDLWLDFEYQNKNQAEYQNYRRELNLMEGVGRIEYQHRASVSPRNLCQLS
jgi:alpha-L-fucosidase 2